MFRGGFLALLNNSRSALTVEKVTGEGDLLGRGKPGEDGDYEQSEHRFHGGFQHGWDAVIVAKRVVLPDGRRCQNR